MKKKIWISIGVILALLWIFPIIWLIVVPFKPRGFSASSLDKLFTGGFTINNFQRLIAESQFILWFLNSVVIAVIQTVLATSFASFVAYVFSQMEFPGKKFLYALLFISFMVPGEAILIPLFKIVAIDMNLSNSIIGVIIPAITNIFSFVIIKSFYDSMPKAYKESAQIDGAGNFKIWYKVYLPMSFGITMTMGVLNFIGSWNSYTWPLLIINSPEKYTLPIALPQFQTAYTAIDLALPMAANLLATLPIIIFFLIFQKQIMEIQMDGGIK